MTIGSIILWQIQKRQESKWEKLFIYLLKVILAKEILIIKLNFMEF